MSKPFSSASFIAPVSLGLGDLIVSLPAVQALIRSTARTYLVMRSTQQHGLAERIEGLAGVVEEDDMASILADSDNATYINLRLHPIQTDFWWGSAEFEKAHPGLRINDILKVICKDFGIDAVFDRPAPLIWDRRADVVGKVVFVPGSDGAYKCWPEKYWLQLCDALVENGWQCIMIGKPDQSKTVKALIDTGLSWVPTETLGEAVDVISSASLVIGVDTGLMHLAVQQSTPTICLYRHNPIYFRDFPKALYMVAPPCHASCIDRAMNTSYESVTDFSSWTPGGWDCAQPEGNRCMDAILPDSVFKTAMQSLEKIEEAI